MVSYVQSNVQKILKARKFKARRCHADAHLELDGMPRYVCGNVFSARSTIVIEQNRIEARTFYRCYKLLQAIPTVLDISNGLDLGCLEDKF